MLETPFMQAVPERHPPGLLPPKQNNAPRMEGGGGRQKRAEGANIPPVTGNQKFDLPPNPILRQHAAPSTRYWIHGTRTRTRAGHCREIIWEVHTSDDTRATEAGTVKGRRGCCKGRLQMRRSEASKAVKTPRFKHRHGG